jgi:hypothetical protein
MRQLRDWGPLLTAGTKQPNHVVFVGVSLPTPLATGESDLNWRRCEDLTVES